MNIIYAQEPLSRAEYPDSIFLAGPTPRDKRVASWRPEALEFLEDIIFRGTVFVPEGRDGGFNGDVFAQREWEWEALEAATVIAAWVPRDLEKLPGFTTNYEIGFYVRSEKLVFGAPYNAPKTSYARALCERYDVPTFYTLKETLLAAVDRSQVWDMDLDIL